MDIVLISFSQTQPLPDVKAIAALFVTYVYNHHPIYQACFQSGECRCAIDADFLMVTINVAAEAVLGILMEQLRIYSVIPRK